MSIDTCATCRHSYGDGNIVFCRVRDGMAKFTHETCDWHTSTVNPMRLNPTVEVEAGGLVLEVSADETFLVGEAKDELATCDGPLDVVVDIGAHHGTFAIQAAERGARVYAVEPSPENAAILRHNIERNDLADRITVIEKAVSWASGLVLPLRKGGFMGQRGIAYKDSFEMECEVETISLHDLMEYVLDRELMVNMVKMDIEGEEFSIVRAGPVPIFGRARFATVDIHPWSNRQYFGGDEGKTAEDYNKALLDWMKDSGFKHARIHKHKAIGSH